MRKLFKISFCLPLIAAFAPCVAWSFPTEIPTVTNKTTVVGSANTAFAKRLMSFDANQDGSIQKLELPNSTHERFDHWDTDKNGVLDQIELGVVIDAQTQVTTQAPSTPAFRDDDPEVNVDEFVGRAMSFDRDGNGTLDRVEIVAMAETFVRVERFKRIQSKQQAKTTSTQRPTRQRTRVSSYASPYFSSLHSRTQPLFIPGQCSNSIWSGVT